MQDLSEPEMINMMSGNGGSQVDLLFYVFTQSKSYVVLGLTRLTV